MRVGARRGVAPSSRPGRIGLLFARCYRLQNGEAKQARIDNARHDLRIGQVARGQSTTAPPTKKWEQRFMSHEGPTSRRNIRWEGDARGVGVAAGTEGAALIEPSLEEMRDPGWVTEDPAAHLGPKLLAWVEQIGSNRWRVARLEAVGMWLEIELEWLRQGRRRDMRADVDALIGSFAEANTSVTQGEEDGAVVFRVATGQPRGDYGPHGHLVRVRVLPPTP